MKHLNRLGALALFVVLLSPLGLQLPAYAAPAEDSPAMAETARAATINVNTASARELAVALEGVGEKRAQAIVDYRQKHGDFMAVEELLQVKGIGEKVLEKNRHKIVLK